MSHALQIELGRRYLFSASHRLHSPLLSPEENCRIFGKCNNPYGHGHNYVLEVSVSGDVEFREKVPTTENLCIEIFQRLKSFPKGRLERIRVEETGKNSFEYAGDHSEGNPL